MNFGITKETKGGNTIPFEAGIKKAVLVKVAAEEVSKKDGGDKFTVLAFYFKGLGEDAKREHKHLEWALKPDDPKLEAKMNALNVRVKHLYECYRPCPADGIGSGAENFKDYFAKIAKQFNEDDAGTPIFTKTVGEGAEKKQEVIPVHLLLCYFNNNLGLPYSPNFIEKINGDKKTLLVIDVRFHKMTQDAPAANGGGAFLPPNMGGQDLNDFVPSGDDAPVF